MFTLMVLPPPMTSKATSVPFVHYQEEGVPKPEPKTETEPGPLLAVVKAPTKSSSDSSFSDPSNDFIRNAPYHRIHRFDHSVSAVSWSSTLADAANQLASSCKYGHNTDLGVGGYGQKIAMYAAANHLGTDIDFPRAFITQHWYNSEIHLYGNAYSGEPNMGTFSEWG